MNDAVMDLLMDRMDHTDSRRGMRGSGRRDRADNRDYEDGYEDGLADGRRGVKGTGRYGRRDRRSDADMDYEHGYEDGLADGRRGVKGTGRYGRDMHESPLRLSKEDMHEWKNMLVNADGSHGPHYDMSQVMSVVDRLGIKFDDFSEVEFCMTVNMLYSDYCHTVKKFVPQEKALEFYACLAKDFLEDSDGPAPWTKLMLYYHCIVNG